MGQFKLSRRDRAKIPILRAQGKSYREIGELLGASRETIRRSVVWEGRSEEKLPRSVAPCGTNAAYVRHLRDGEKPCPWCSEAHAADMREWRKKNGKRKNVQRRRHEGSPERLPLHEAGRQVAPDPPHQDGGVPRAEAS